MKNNIKLIKLDMSLSKEHNHPQIKTDDTQYLVKYNNKYFCGNFNKEWFGLNFNGWYNHLQFDAPDYNKSRWQQIWEMKEVN